ncbi:hypothetical protein [Campylobacter vulpis]|uniref:hypothetical protein n=1 Tax=Campylobacter vulpis TaxID=1655500 RepID=UPI001BCE609B|nr:hypothetical protein [Campylobacter vulpis]MBS4407728.1 DUF342 domain-containing protein [Campylobacter vulpis]
MRDKKLRQEILALENEVKELEKTLGAIKQRLINLKDLAWDKQSKKESSSMYKVLKKDKTHTMVKSELGDIKVDKDFMEKEITKHLDNPNLRGMVTTKEMLSFPKIAKGVKAEYDERNKNYTWKVKANDGNVLIYGSREYIQNNKAINRLLTAHSKTEYGERQDRGEQGQLRREFNDRDFLRPANEIIPQQDKSARDFKSKLKEFNAKNTNQTQINIKELKR